MAVLGAVLVAWSVAYRAQRIHSRRLVASKVWRQLPRSITLWVGLSLLLASLADTRRLQLLATYAGVAVTGVLLDVLRRVRRHEAVRREGAAFDLPPDAAALFRTPMPAEIVGEMRRVLARTSGDPGFHRAAEAALRKLESGEGEQLLRDGARANRFFDRQARWLPIATAVAAAGTCGAVVWLFRS